MQQDTRSARRFRRPASVRFRKKAQAVGIIANDRY
jgi:hypothetical protein